MHRRRIIVLLVLGAALADCGQGGDRTVQPAAPTIEPTLDPRLQTTSLPQHGSD